MTGEDGIEMSIFPKGGVMDIILSVRTMNDKKSHLVNHLDNGGVITSEEISYMIREESVLFDLVNSCVPIEITRSDYNFIFAIAVYGNKVTIASSMLDSAPDVLDVVSYQNFFTYLYPFFKGNKDIVQEYMNYNILVSLLPMYDYFAFRYACSYGWATFVEQFFLSFKLTDGDTIRCVARGMELAATHGHLNVLMVSPKHYIPYMNPKIMDHVTSDIYHYLFQEFIGKMYMGSYKFEGANVINEGMKHLVTHING